MRLIDADLLGLTDMEIIMCDGDYKEALKMLIDKIEHAPTIEPQRKKGKWTKDCACEICGFKPWYERDIHTLSFCPNCGADLRGD